MLMHDTKTFKNYRGEFRPGELVCVSFGTGPKAGIIIDISDKPLNPPVLITELTSGALSYIHRAGSVEPFLLFDLSIADHPLHSVVENLIHPLPVDKIPEFIQLRSQVDALINQSVTLTAGFIAGLSNSKD